MGQINDGDDAGPEPIGAVIEASSPKAADAKYVPGTAEAKLSGQYKRAEIEKKYTPSAETSP